MGARNNNGDLFQRKLIESGINFRRETIIADTGNITDFIIEDKLLVELKATRLLTREFYRQTQNYLQQSGLKLGLLVNFRNKYLKPVRIIRIDSFHS